MVKEVKCLLALVVLLTACQHKSNKAQPVDELRREMRQRYYEQQLQKVRAELAVTDSLLLLAEADPDTLNVAKRIRRDSLRHEFDVQGAKIRYIHRKQKELQ